MSPEEAIHRAEAGALLPVYLVVGEERYAAIQVVHALRSAALASGVAELNEEKLVAGEADIDRVVSAARMAPMMAKRRFVLVQSLERWDAKAGDGDLDDASPDEDTKTPPLDRLAEYAASPVPETCLVLWGTKLDGRRKIVALAKKSGFMVSCEPLPRAKLPGWIVREAKARGHAIAGDVAEMLAEIAGPDLSAVADALERVSLYAGAAQPITEDAISACVVRMRQSSVWELVGAVGSKKLGLALTALDDIFDARDRGLPLVGLLAWSIRQLVKFEAATRAGKSPEEAARLAGAPPFKARELAQQVRAVSASELERWLLLLAETDLALKGSRRPPRAILEDAITQMCGQA
jgi:DNA polymerase III subunit delta